MVVDSKIWFSKRQPLNDPEKTWPQILAVIIGCLAAFNNGLLFSWSSPFLPKITKDKENYDITEDQASHFNTIQPVAMVICCSFFSKLSDIIGRKNTLLLIVVPQSLAWITAAVAENVYLFYASRVCSGISDSIMFTVLPVYIGEVATPKVRETWGSGLVTAILIGQFLINVIGGYFSVEQTSYICIPLPIIFVILFWQMPESPYYLIMQNKDEDAKNVLRFLKRKKNVEDDFFLLGMDVERQMSESGSWKDLWTIDSNRRAITSGIFLRASQQLSGTTVFVMYTQYIFEKSGGNFSSQLSSIIFMGVCALLNILVVLFIVHRLGRRLSYIFSAIPCALVLFSMAVYFYLDQFRPDVNLTSLNWFPLAGMLSYQIFASVGVMLIPTLMLGELFSASIKAKAMTLMMMVFGSMVVVTNNLFYFLNYFFGLFAPFLFFGLCTAASGGLAFIWIPETKGKTLEEIQQCLKK